MCAPSATGLRGDLILVGLRGVFILAALCLTLVEFTELRTGPCIECVLRAQSAHFEIAFRATINPSFSFTKTSPIPSTVMPEESPRREESSPEVERNGRPLERSRSPVRYSEPRPRRSRSPVAGETHRRHSRGEHGGDEGRHHRRHHHHHHRGHHRGRDKEMDVDKEEFAHRDRSATPENGSGVQPRDEKPRDIPTGPRAYRSRQRYRPESNYGRLGYVVGYDDNERDDEDRLREVERRRDAERGKEEPKIIFKGRGVMKYRERYY